MNTTFFGDCRDTMRDLKEQGVRVQCCVTSPPYYGLRDYGHPGQIGLEKTPAEYVAALVEVFDGVRELLAGDGVLWLNLGDSYGDKQLLGMPWRVAFALQAAGWYLRQDVIWHKPNPMPESVTDRCTKAHEYLFLLTKSERYYWDPQAMQEPAAPASLARWAQDVEGQIGSDRVPGKTNGNMKAVGGPRGKGGKNAFRGQGHFRSAETGPANREGRDMADVGAGETRNRRSVWTVATKPYSGAHFAVFPTELIEPCVLAGSRPGDVVLDPFMGSGTTAQVAQALGRQWIGCELNTEYAPLQQARTAQAALAI